MQFTYLAGYDQVVRELQELRNRQGRASLDVPGGNRDEGAREIAALARQAAGSYHQSVINYWAKIEDGLVPEIKLETRARQLLHNVSLELVGRVLNLGRSHAAAGGERPLRAAIEQALVAMRSEQLDTNTCGPCSALHGLVVYVGSPLYVAHTPPNDCLGRGRCRGIWVYADRVEDLRIPGGQQRFPMPPDQLTFSAA